MVEGHVTAMLGGGPGFTQAHEWVAGESAVGGVGGNRGAVIAGQAHYPLRAVRCSRCGFVELFAGS